jgi:hypothetical protein
MHEAMALPLESWASFYVIVGSSAGALTGLQFVVMTLIGEAGRTRSETISAFGTPNVVHFCAALLISSLLSVPWSLRPAGIAVAMCGVAGVGYTAIVMRRARRQSDYRPVFEDWLWHVLLPALAYGILLVAGILLGRDRAGALFAIGPAALLLVFVGIHNAWDTVTFLMTEQRPEPGGGSGADRAQAPAPEPQTGGEPSTTPL